LLLDGDGDHFVPQPPCAFERQDRKPPVARNEPVLHGYLMKPRSEEAMNSSNSSTSGEGSSSARIRSTACEVFRPDRAISRNAVCSFSTAALSNPRRCSPTLFAP